MQTAIAARTGSTVPELVEIPCPPPPGTGGCDDILCRTIELGICGTDREILHSANPWTPPGSPFLVLGHECIARVEAIGDAVSDWQVGDLVVPAVRRSLPGQTRRLDYLPLGKFTERGIWSEHGFSAPRWLDKPQHLFRVPAEIADIAVFTEPLAVAEKGVNEALVLQQARLGQDIWQTIRPRVLVTGMGPIGFAAALACLVRGWSVTMFGRDRADSFRATLAGRFGVQYWSAADGCFDLPDVEQDGFDLVLECTGSDDVLVSAAAALRSCGVMVWLGSTRVPQPASLNVARMMRQALLCNHLHVGTVNAAPRDFRDALSHLAQLKQTYAHELQSLITARVTLSESLWHYEHRQPQGVKTVIEYPV
ncbi:MAG: alcohol dehydrogenase catalytic domain-containing protein [Planctomycetota bacterium]|nr:alcohol dehydrogenase catalytic domain-containing protein [Planctomycetota bacterium]